MAFFIAKNNKSNGEKTMSLNGIDISAWQDGIDVAAVPADFVIMKATEGVTYTDRCCDAFYQAAKASGKQVGVYMYADGSGAIAEADYFVNAVQGYIGEAVLILDWESGGNSAFGNVAYAKQILDRIYERTGVKPLIYMSGSVCRECDWSSVVAGDYGLWQAYYTTSGGYQPGASVYSQPYWGDLVMLQYSSSGSLSGYGGNLDMNVFYGDVETWKAYAGGSGVTVTPAAPVLDPAQQCPQVDGGNETIKSGQLHSANFTGRVITADGVVGEETNRQKVRVLQRALNADYAAGIAEDGEAGSETYGALGSHYVEAGETQFMVTAAEILLLLHGYDPAGVECPGVFGDGLGAAVEAFQRDNGLTIDRICGVATFSALIA